MGHKGTSLTKSTGVLYHLYRQQLHDIFWQKIDSRIFE